MPKGVPKNGLWHGLERIEEWLRRQEPRPCACGCGEMVIPKKAHRHRGIPKYVQGHHSRVEHYNYKGIEKWVVSEQGKHLCACGCGGAIRIRKQHHCSGIPRFLLGHHPPPSFGIGVAHPAYIRDRSKVKARNGRNFTPATMKEIWLRCQGRCVRCGDSSHLECDHIVPVSAGGGPEASNGQLLCADCHRLKTIFEQALSRSAEGVRRFFRSLVAFIEFTQQEISKNDYPRNTAQLPQALQVLG